MTRPLLATSDPDVLDDLLRLGAVAGVEVDVASDVAAVRKAWDAAPLVVVGADLLDALGGARVARRDGVVALGRDLDDAGVWQRAVTIGAERVVFLPDAERWLVDALADAAEGRVGQGTVVGVIGGRGGAGATTLACGLGLAAVRRGVQAVLIDADPLGGGIDVVFRAEHEAGLRWPDLAGTRGRVPSAALARALPRMHELSVLSWDRGEHSDLSVEAARAVLSAARKSHGLVVVDLPRHLDEVAREVLVCATTTFLVVPAEVRAAAAGARVAARAAGLCRDLRLVVRGPAPGGVSAGEVQRAIQLPLAGELRAEPGLARDFDEGVPPGTRRGSPLATLCDAFLSSLLPERIGRAA